MDSAELSKRIDKVMRNSDRVRILNLLLTGEHLSAIDISERLNVHDTRSHIRYLKYAGFPVDSNWVIRNGKRFKVYYIKTKSHR